MSASTSISGLELKRIPGFPSYFLTPRGNVFSSRRGKWLKPVEVCPNPDKLSYYMYSLSDDKRKIRSIVVRSLILKTYGPETASHYNPIMRPPDYSNLPLPTLKEMQDLVNL